MLETNIKVVDGYLHAPEGPGLGTRLRKDVFSRSDLIIETTDEPGDHFHWGGHESQIFEVVGDRGERKVKYRDSWTEADPDLVSKAKKR